MIIIIIGRSKSLSKKKVLTIITETLMGSASTINSSTLAKLNPSVGIIFPSSTALLTGIAILITNEYIRKLKKDMLSYVMGLLLLLCCMKEL